MWESQFKFFFIVATILSLIALVAIGVVAVHFIGKYW